MAVLVVRSRPRRAAGHDLVRRSGRSSIARPRPTTWGLVVCSPDATRAGALIDRYEARLPTETLPSCRPRATVELSASARDVVHRAAEAYELRGSVGRTSGASNGSTTIRIARDRTAPGGASTRTSRSAEPTFGEVARAIVAIGLLPGRRGWRAP